MTPTAAPIFVLWTVAAQRQLRQALAEAACHQGPNAVTNAMNNITHHLRLLFPNAEGIVVQQQFVGFRSRDDEFILLVEVAGTDRPGRHIVKLAFTEAGQVNAERLGRELDAWESCRPHGLRHDLVFMTLEPCRHNNALVGLIYGDAQQFLGLPTATSLEHAFLGAVCHDTPSAASVALVLGQLYERIGHLLYPQSFRDDPADTDFVFRLPTLSRNLAGWEAAGSDAAHARQDINTWAASGRGEFRDPIDYFRFLTAVVPWDPAPAPLGGIPASQPPDQQTTPSPTDRPPTRSPAELARAAHWLPRMLRGCSHGDLHGRNVLVGVVRNRALWPAVFDYEHMRPGNLLGWDFVKMETELKLRAYPELFPGDTLQHFVCAVQKFEITLAERTEECHRRSYWPEAVASGTREDRLRSLLLGLRHQAGLHLGADRGRPREWLDEYYFLLACYGVSVVGFENLQTRERIGAYVSAGVATARFLWSREDRFDAAVAVGQTF